MATGGFLVQDTDKTFDHDTHPRDTEISERPADADQNVIHDDEPSEDQVHVLADSTTPEEDKAIRAESLRTFGKFSTIGLHLLFAVLIGYVIGRWLDNFFDIFPVMTLFWIGCGMISTLLECIKIVKQAQKLDDDSAPKT